jgi:sec-independent protein translocase protein TatB
MLDIGWSEMAMIALIALIVIGPKDLPRVMRSVGQWTRKARNMARDFQNSLDDMIEDEELREAKDSVKSATQRFNKRDPFNIGGSLEKHVDPDGSLREHASAIDSEARKTERDVNSADEGHSPRDPNGGSGESITAPDAPAADGSAESRAEPSGGAAVVQRETPVAPGNSVNAAPPSANSGVEADQGAGDGHPVAAKDGEPETAGFGRATRHRES